MRTNDGVEFAIGNPANNDFPLIRVSNIGKVYGGDPTPEISKDLKLLPIPTMSHYVAGAKRTKFLGSHRRSRLVAVFFWVFNLFLHVAEEAVRRAYLSRCEHVVARGAKVSNKVSLVLVIATAFDKAFEMSGHEVSC